MIHLNEAPDAPEWFAQPATCRRCGTDWHARCEPLAMPDCELGDN